MVTNLVDDDDPFGWEGETNYADVTGGGHNGHEMKDDDAWMQDDGCLGAGSVWRSHAESGPASGHAPDKRAAHMRYMRRTGDG